MSSGFNCDKLCTPLVSIVLRVVQSILMNLWIIRIAKIFGKNKYTVFPSLVNVLPVQWVSHDHIWSHRGNSLPNKVAAPYLFPGGCQGQFPPNKWLVAQIHCLQPCPVSMMSQGYEHSRWAFWRLYKEGLTGFITHNC